MVVGLVFLKQVQVDLGPTLVHSTVKGNWTWRSLHCRLAMRVNFRYILEETKDLIQGGSGSVVDNCKTRVSFKLRTTAKRLWPNGAKRLYYIPLSPFPLHWSIQYHKYHHHCFRRRSGIASDRSSESKGTDGRLFSWTWSFYSISTKKTAVHLSIGDFIWFQQCRRLPIISRVGFIFDGWAPSKAWGVINFISTTTTPGGYSNFHFISMATQNLLE